MAPRGGGRRDWHHGGARASPPAGPTDQQGQQPPAVQPAQHRRVAELAAAAAVDDIRPIQEKQKQGNYIPGGPMDPKFALPPPAPEIQIKDSPPASPHSSQGMGAPRAPVEDEMEDMDEQQRAAWMAGKEEENNQVEEDLADLLEINSRMEKEKEGEKEGESEEMQQGEDM